MYLAYVFHGKVLETFKVEPCMDSEVSYLKGFQVKVVDILHGTRVTIQLCRPSESHPDE